MSKANAALSEQFIMAFNGGNLDEVMSFFSDDATFVALDGAIHDGRDQIRRVLAEIVGTVKFETIDQFADTAAGWVAATWRLHQTYQDKPVWWEGIDVLHWHRGKVRFKGTYGKCVVPAIQSSGLGK
ncbi:ketosteroid isomerase-like protein [Mycobacterium frederiksbergense]|uniref:Ketosteroid isomerase-like protein n=1 Tax=Mycolicibacterium frederiksbergense TaxID=117567 RepID=A0ABT6L0H5_9MYCO|nr:nuclear transport factor 2 family protein [Mycolicibacterium frederiksbergense]MDH6196066.1 ketosteroid isomerase-like protein [Mycolicibacterium frederiksbergense]